MRVRRYPTRASRRSLTPSVVAVLLEGWGAPASPNDPDPFLVFDIDLAETWRAHRQELMKEAKRRGIATPWAAREFDD